MGRFDKTAHSIEQQIGTLRDRGLIIDDEARAHHYLANISYFRLSAYTRPFYQPRILKHRFLPNTYFDDVLHLYIFDRELRLLLLDAVERLEVSLRAQMSNILAEHHGPHGYLSAEIFDTRYNHNWLLTKLEQVGNTRQVENFLAHYRKKYHAAPKQPPIWMAVELLTFKEVSTLFSQLRLSTDTQRFERHYGVKMTVLRSWFRSLSDLRNVCAHHGRVWNREFGSRPEIPRKQPVHWPHITDRIKIGSSVEPNQEIDPRRRLYLHLVVIEILMRTVSPTSQWAERLIALLEQYPQISRPHMGFPENWANEPLWRDAAKQVRSAAIS